MLQIWRELAELMERKKALEGPRSFHQPGGLPLLLRALAVLEYGITGDERAAREARDIEVRRDPVQEAFFADHWRRARDWLPEDDPVLAAVLGDGDGDGDGDAEAATERLVESSRLGNDDHLEALLGRGAAAIRRSQDPAMVIARVLRPLMREHRRAGDAITAAENELGARLANLLFEVYGNDVSPDATFTLRISDGRVLGYPYNGTLAPWRTVFHGMFARNAEFDGHHPFDLPDAWLRARDRIDMHAAVDFVCTVDSTGGNSGSPVIDRKGRLVGLLFDGNIESLANEFLYGERVERSVCVHPQGIVEALRKVYDAQRLLRELRR